LRESRRRDFCSDVAPASLHSISEESQTQLADLARCVRDACSGEACFIAYRAKFGEGLAQVGLSPRTAHAIWARLDALFAREGLKPHSICESAIHLGPAQLVSLTGLADEISLVSRLTAVLSSERSLMAIVALIATDKHKQQEIEAMLRVAGRATLLALQGWQYAKANEFWRERALATSEDLARERRSSLDDARRRERLNRALEALARLPRSKRFQGFGEIAAKLSDSDAWALALAEGGGLALRASFGLPPPLLSRVSALRLSFERHITILRGTQRANALIDGAKGVRNGVEDAPDARAEVRRKHTESASTAERAYPEDGLLRGHGFAAYVAVPFSRGAILLASSKPLQAAIVSCVQEFVTRAQPIVGAWMLEEEVERYRTLVRKLGLRLLTTADLERARIARDLHDDQAQLIATLKLVLSAPKIKARKLVAEIERELRARITALRPTFIGRLSLKRAIQREFGRLKAAGIRSRLVSAVAERGLDKPAREICFQVVREALANVARHTTATEVVVTLERRNRVLRLEVANDGVDPQRGFSGKGVGLASLSERLRLLGGKCSFTTGRRKYRLVAEIPCVDR
jgi:signal transduction histidine kinase